MKYRHIITLVFLIVAMNPASAQYDFDWSVSGNVRNLHDATNQVFTDLAVDGKGNSYVTGTFTDSLIFSTGDTLISSGKSDAFLAKVSVSGSILWAMAFGGQENDEGVALAYNETTKMVYIAGNTSSNDFPVGSSSYIDDTYNGGKDIFMLVLADHDTAAVIDHGTFFGGSMDEVVQDMDITMKSGNLVAITGQSYSSDLPGTSGAFQVLNMGAGDAFVAKFSHPADNLNNLLYTTYIGGSLEDAGAAITLTEDGVVYLAGNSESRDLPVTSGAFQTSAQREMNGFLLKLNSTGTALQYNTYIAGELEDEINAMSVLPNGEVYLLGTTRSPGFPTTQKGTKFMSGASDAFITHVNADGSGLIYSSFWGGNGLEYAHDIFISPYGDLFVVGESFSDDFPGIAFGDRQGNIFLSQFSINNGGGMVLSRKYGIDTDTEIPAIVFASDSRGSIYMSGLFDNELIFGSDTLLASSPSLNDWFLTRLSACKDTSCVWPGDADRNNIANAWDILPIGIGYGQIGHRRNNAVEVWIGQYAQQWEGGNGPLNFASGVNYRHADCNGDGGITTFDLTAIIANYGRAVSKNEGSLSNNLAAPELGFDLSTDSIAVGKRINVPVTLGTDNIPVDSAYGIAFSVKFNPGLVMMDSVKVDYTGSWLGVAGTDLISVDKTFYEDGTVEIGISRIDHQNISGKGTIATLSFVMVENLEGKKLESRPFVLDFERVTLITASEAKIDLNPVSDSLVVFDPETGINNYTREQFVLYPNPSNGGYYLDAGSESIKSLKIYDLSGKEVFRMKEGFSGKVMVNIGNVPSGVFMLHAETVNGATIRKKLICIKE